MPFFTAESELAKYKIVCHKRFSYSQTENIEAFFKKGGKWGLL